MVFIFTDETAAQKGNLPSQQIVKLGLEGLVPKLAYLDQALVIASVSFIGLFSLSFEAFVKCEVHVECVNTQSLCDDSSKEQSRKFCLAKSRPGFD